MTAPTAVTDCGRDSDIFTDASGTGMVIQPRAILGCTGVTPRVTIRGSGLDASEMTATPPIRALALMVGDGMVIADGSDPGRTIVNRPASGAGVEPVAIESAVTTRTAARATTAGSDPTATDVDAVTDDVVRLVGT